MSIKVEITRSGGLRMLHDDEVDLSFFGRVIVERASHVEFDNERGDWTVTSAKTMKVLARRKTRKAALAWEKEHYSPTGKGWAELTGGKS